MARKKAGDEKGGAKFVHRLLEIEMHITQIHNIDQSNHIQRVVIADESFIRIKGVEQTTGGL